MNRKTISTSIVIIITLLLTTQVSSTCYEQVFPIIYGEQQDQPGYTEINSLDIGIDSIIVGGKSSDTSVLGEDVFTAVPIIIKHDITDNSVLWSYYFKCSLEDNYIQTVESILINNDEAFIAISLSGNKYFTIAILQYDTGTIVTSLQGLTYLCTTCYIVAQGMNFDSSNNLYFVYQSTEEPYFIELIKIDSTFNAIAFDLITSNSFDIMVNSIKEYSSSLLLGGYLKYETTEGTAFFSINKDSGGLNWLGYENQTDQSNTVTYVKQMDLIETQNGIVAYSCLQRFVSTYTYLIRFEFQDTYEIDPSTQFMAFDPDSYGLCQSVYAYNYTAQYIVTLDTLNTYEIQLYLLDYTNSKLEKVLSTDLSSSSSSLTGLSAKFYNEENIYIVGKMENGHYYSNFEDENFYDGSRGFLLSLNQEQCCIYITSSNEQSEVEIITVNSFFYLNDWFILATSQEGLFQQIEIIQRDLQNAYYDLSSQCQQYLYNFDLQPDYYEFILGQDSQETFNFAISYDPDDCYTPTFQYSYAQYQYDSNSQNYENAGYTPYFLVFSDENQTLVVTYDLNTDIYNKKNTYIEYTIKISNGQIIENQIFYLDFTHVCDYLILEEYNPQNFTYTEIGDNIAFSLQDFIKSNTTFSFCYLSYEAVPYEDSNYMIYDSYYNEINVNFQEFTGLVVYKWTYTVTLDAYNYTLSVDFTITVTDQVCAVATVTSQDIPDCIYEIGTDSMSCIGSLDFIVSETSCTLTYSFINVTSGLTLDSIIIQFYGTSLIISSSDTDLIGQYTEIEVIGEISDYGIQNSTTFWLYLVSSTCGVVDIQTVQINNQTYYTGDTVDPIEIIDWSSGSSYCTDFLFTAYLIVDEGLDILPDPLFQFTYNSLLIDLSDHSIYGTYNIRIKGQLESGEYETMDFTIEIISICSQCEITPPDMQNITYYTYSSVTNSYEILSIPSIEFDCDDYCSKVVTLAATKSGEDVDLFNNSPFYINLDITELEIYLDQNQFIGTYTFVYTGLSYGVSEEVTFTITIESPCEVTITLVSQLATTYVVTGNVLNLIEYSVSESGDYCSTISCDLFKQDESAIQSEYGISLNYPYISVQSTDDSLGQSETTFNGILKCIDLDTSNYHTLSFSIQYLSDSCNSFTIEIDDALQTAYTYYIGDSALSIDYSAYFTTSPSFCANLLSFSIIDDAGSELNSSIFTDDSIDYILYVETQDGNEIQEFSIIVSGYLNDASEEVALTVSIQASCNQETITTTSLPVQEYITSDIVMVINLDDYFSLNNDQCSLIYAIYNTDGDAIESSIFTQDSNILLVTTSSSDDAGEYYILVKGYISDYPNNYEYTIITVTIYEGCTTNLVLQWVENTLTLDNTIDEYISYNLTENLEQNIISCGTDYYFSIGQNQLDINDYTLDESDGILTIYTNNSAYDQLTKFIQISATHVNSNILTSTSLIIELLFSINCDNAIITAPNIADRIYEFEEEMLTFIIDQWESNYESCGQFTYDISLKDGSNIPNFIIFDSSAMLFGIETSDMSNIDTSYNFRITGVQGTLYSNAEFIIYISCTITSIRSSFSTDTITTYMSVIQTFVLAENFQQEKECLYTLNIEISQVLNGDGEDVTNSFSIATINTNQDLEIYSNDPSDADIYTIFIKASYDNAFNEIELTLDLQCEIEYFTSQNQLVNETYYISDSYSSQIMILTVDEFSYEPPGCKNPSLQYSIVNIDGVDTSSFLDFDTTNNQIKIQDVYLSYVGTYNFEIKASQKRIYSTYTWVLDIVYSDIKPPYFETYPEDQKVQINTNIKYILPEIISESDYTGAISILSYGKSSSFTKIYENSFQNYFTIYPETTDTGNYTIKLKLYYEENENLYTKYQFTIQVISFTSLTNTTQNQTETNTDDNKNVNETNSNIDDYEFDENNFGFDYEYYELIENNSSANSTSNITIRNYIQLQTYDSSLTAKISTINEKGVVTIQFNEKLFTPKNFKKMNDFVMKLSIIPSSDQEMENLKFNWTVTSFQNKEINIQLDFENPLYISKNVNCY